MQKKLETNVDAINLYINTVYIAAYWKAFIEVVKEK